MFNIYIKYIQIVYVSLCVYYPSTFSTNPPSESLQLKVVTGHAPSFQTSKATHRNDGLEPLASGWGGYQWLETW